MEEMRVMHVGHKVLRMSRKKERDTFFYAFVGLSFFVIIVWSNVNVKKFAFGVKLRPRGLESF